MSKHSSNARNTKRQLLKWAGFIFVGLLIYFGNKTLQTHLGHQALQQIEFEVLDLNVALAKADAHEKLVLADMSAIWCPTCRKLDKTIFANQDVNKMIEEHFVFARVEYESEQGKAFMQKYRVAGFPVLLVLDGEGKKLTRLPLTFESDEFIGNLEAILAMR
ncbi:MAG: hypothetical protein Alis3KO_30270 [Aliiglaciecola sp.]